MTGHTEGEYKTLSNISLSKEFKQPQHLRVCCWHHATYTTTAELLIIPGNAKEFRNIEAQLLSC